MTGVYVGRDFALQPDNDAWCQIFDDGEMLSCTFPASEPQDYSCCAVDCPFGIPKGFGELLDGRVPVGRSEDSFLYRETERWARREIAAYRSSRLCPRFFNRSAHVKPAVALRTVPGCMHWMAVKSGYNSLPRSRPYQDARRGKGTIIEAHPRLFLYSAVERVVAARETLGQSVPNGWLEAVRNYKENREQVYGLLQRESAAWQGKYSRKLPHRPPAGLMNTIHSFDAWLAGLTAWAHIHSETIDWKMAGLTTDVVDAEGHILILSQKK